MKQGTFVVLASGRGSNFQAIIDRVKEGSIHARCVCLITDNPDAYAITRANKAGIPHEVVSYKSFSDKIRYEEALMEVIARYNPDLIILAGYMRLLGDRIVDTYHGKMINIHPSLLPAFAGLHAQQQALDYGTKVAGCTVHFVTRDMDAGPVIIQRTVPVLDDDDEESLSSRILIEEHQAYPDAVRLFFEHRLRIEGRRVRILP
ncbi:phosphoribosylglycinamide formyltransferase [Methanospirillum purgamenti]|uniref:phosphoribosylglycinamide formyltransferase 1 n=1 Tax=Methanospirillum hungatei TaxID=2203 RepID=A0A8F5ZEJ9_METHU|nr:phosphoribosylglycinamide formyltransferase [Methanospirillum hungatei]QXO93459.1 phosphoribosylglycinamide formyltransferase [Methanospirillum hungatei]